MPDYRGIKKKAEDENREFERKLEALERKYYDLEDRLADTFVKRVHERIEAGVYSFYKEGKSPNIQKNGKLFPNYTFSARRWWNIRVYKNYEIEKVNVDFVFSNPEQVVNENFIFPSEKCVKSFMEKVNRILNEDRIRINVIEAELPKRLYFSIFAKLGKL